MISSELVEKVQDFSDLELAVLLSLVAGQHCLIETDPEAVEPTCQELQLVSSSAHHDATTEDRKDRLKCLWTLIRSGSLFRVHHDT